MLTSFCSESVWHSIDSSDVYTIRDGETGAGKCWYYTNADTETLCEEDPESVAYDWCTVRVNTIRHGEKKAGKCW